MSEEYYKSLVKGKTDLGMNKIADLALSASMERTSSFSCLRTNRIRVMDREYRVMREGDALVDVKMSSIVILITRNDSLKADVTIKL